MSENRKPFGLTLACKVAADAIRGSVAPVSIILYNLLALQKDTLFPKSLDVQFFANNKRVPNDQEKRVVAKILDELRGPTLDKAALLENHIKEAWVIKKAPPVEIKNTNKPKVPNKKLAAKEGQKNVLKKPKNVVKPPVVAPVVVVKKSRLI